jgi:hypothetical protein
MPELSRFFGIIIRMFREPDEPHHDAHLHAVYQDHAAVYGLDPIECIAGGLPTRQHRLVLAWVELHQAELVADWKLVCAGHRPRKIVPLR